MPQPARPEPPDDSDRQTEALVVALRRAVARKRADGEFGEIKVYVHFHAGRLKEFRLSDEVIVRDPDQILGAGVDTGPRRT